MQFIRENFAYLIILTLAVLLVYGFNLHNGLFWDDNDWIVNNPNVHTLAWSNIKTLFTTNTLAGIGLQSNYYRPILFISFAFNYIVSGSGPVGYHLINDLLHLFNGYLIFALLLWATRQRMVAGLTALIFLLQPMQTEAVTYVAGRGDPLNVFFMLLALAILVFGRSRWPVWSWVLSLLALALAILSRETAIIFPGLAVVFYLAFVRGQHERWQTWWRGVGRALRRVWPYIALISVYGLLRLTVLNFQNTLNFYTSSNIYSEHLSVRMFTFMRVLWRYCQLLLWPTGLHMEESVPVYTSLWQLPVWTMVLVLVGLLFWLRRLYRQEQVVATKNAGLLSPFRAWLFASGWFFVNLIPTSGITPVNAILYEHWLYLALVGPAFLAAYYLAKGWAWLGMRQLNTARVIIGILLIGYLGFYGVQGVRANLLWGDPIAFYKNILKYDFENVRILNNLGNHYYNAKNMAEAETYYRQATEVADVFPQPYFNLGAILQARGDYHGAIDLFQKAVAIDPNFYQSYQNLAEIYAAQGQLARAQTALEKLTELRPLDPAGYYNLALVYQAEGKLKEAKQAVQQGMQLTAEDSFAQVQFRQLLNELNGSDK